MKVFHDNPWPCAFVNAVGVYPAWQAFTFNANKSSYLMVPRLSVLLDIQSSERYKTAPLKSKLTVISMNDVTRSRTHCRQGKRAIAPEPDEKRCRLALA